MKSVQAQKNRWKIPSAREWPRITNLLLAGPYFTWRILINLLGRLVRLRSASQIKLVATTLAETVGQPKTKSIATILAGYVNQTSEATPLIFTPKTTSQLLSYTLPSTKNLEYLFYKLNLAANLMRAGQHEGKTLHCFFVEEMGLPVNFNPDDCRKTAAYYNNNHTEQITSERMQATIGIGINSPTRVSLYFFFCQDCQRLVITSCNVNNYTSNN